MCKPFSCIVTKGKKVLICENPNQHSHEDIVKEHDLKDDKLINRAWIRIEVYPEDDNYTSNVDGWKFQVDERDTLPEWFTLNQEVYEDLCRKAAKKWKDTCIDKLGRYVIEYADGRKEWYFNGLQHRENGPAYEGRYESKEYWINGKIHNANGPAIEDDFGYRAYYKNNKRHRLDGPAIEGPDVENEYYIDDKQLSEEEFIQLTQNS